MKLSNTAIVTEQIIRRYKVRVTRTSIHSELAKHPYGDTLSAINYVFDLWGITNGIFRIETKALDRFPTPFIAHLTTKNNEFALINHVNETNVIFIDKNGKKQEMAFDDFKKYFSGDVLVAAPNEESGEEEYNKKRVKEIISRYYAVIIAGVCLLVLIGIMAAKLLVI